MNNNGYSINYIAGSWKLYEGCTCNGANYRGEFASNDNTKEIVWQLPTFNAPEVAGITGNKYKFRNGVALNVDLVDATEFLRVGNARDVREIDKMTIGGYDSRVS